MLQLEEQYIQTKGAREKLESLRASLRASESILKSAAMKYDLDPSNANALVSAYTDNLQLQKSYYYAVCKYNIAFAELISRMGVSLSEYHQLYPGK